MPEPDLKEQVRRYWNQQSCDTQAAAASKFTLEYFEEIETFRYRDQPFIHAFAQFSRYRGKKVLEVGFGAGTDFIQWLRAGAAATGIDLTQEALDNVSRRIQQYHLPAPEKICVADAENLPFGENSFDLGYSFGVLHHSPDTAKAVAQLVRVIRPGGELKIMLYNRHSVYAVNQWIKHAALKGRPWKSLAWVLWRHMESPGTKAFTPKEIFAMLSRLPLEDIRVHTEPTSGDYLSASAFPPLNWCNRLALRLAGYRHDWAWMDFVDRDARSGAMPAPRKTPAKLPPRHTGNALGFYHCISAKKSG
jgi:ubiquinone/menaquinone biosynthesis C-methylase UbiE